MEAAASLYGHNIFMFDDDGSHHSRLHVGSCGVTSMYILMRLLGPSKPKMRAILRIQISNVLFFYYDGEAILESTFAGKGLNTYKRGGSFLGNTTLVSWPLLKKLELVVRRSPKGIQIPEEELIRHFFRADMKVRPQLIQKLCKIFGSVCFEISHRNGAGYVSLMLSTYSLQQQYDELKGYLMRPVEAYVIPQEIASIATMAGHIIQHIQETSRHYNTI